MGFSIGQTSFQAHTAKVILGLFLLTSAAASTAVADSGESTSQVSVSITIAGRKTPAQPFAGSNLPEGGWVGGATFSSSSFPSADVPSVIISPVASGDGAIEANRLWIKSEETGNQFVPLSEMSSRPLANPNASSGAQLPDLEFRPTWEDAPGKYQARLKISPGNNEATTAEPGFFEFEAEVPSFMNFEVENTLVRFVPSGTTGQAQGARNIQVLVTTNSDLWKVKLTSNMDGVYFELIGNDKGRHSPVSGYSTSNATVSGRQPVKEYLLAFKPICPADKLKDGSIQVTVEGRTGR